jgi:predicted nucleotidyltransferase
MILFPLSIGGIHNAIDFALKYIPPTEIYINDYHGNRYVWNSVSNTALNKLRNELEEYANCQHSAIQQQFLSRMSSIVSTQPTTTLTSYIDKPNQENHIRLFPELYI